MTELDHRVKGVDHAAFPTFDPAATVRFYRDVLGFPVVHSICAAGWGPEDHPDFIHFFFDIGNDDRIAFFYYFGARAVRHRRTRGDVYAGFGAGRARTSSSAPATSPSTSTARRTCWSTGAGSTRSDWPVEMQIQHETIESIYTHDPNGYMVELTRAMRPVTPQEDLDANLTIDALLDVVAEPEPSLGQAARPQGRADRRARRRLGARAEPAGGAR